jgi:adenosylmethionine-8-amino-7-oxononanoate aminotransferase
VDRTRRRLGVARLHPDGRYADNRPVIVERAEGRELIDVDGRRYLDAISSLWVTTLGHRVPELDAALRSTSSTGWPTPRCSATATAS